MFLLRVSLCVKMPCFKNPSSYKTTKHNLKRKRYKIISNLFIRNVNLQHKPNMMILGHGIVSQDGLYLSLEPLKPEIGGEGLCCMGRVRRVAVWVSRNQHSNAHIHMM